MSAETASPWPNTAAEPEPAVSGTMDGVRDVRDAAHDRRRRIVVIAACVLFVALVLIACEAWRRTRSHWQALCYYSLLGASPKWTCDELDWRQGGSTTVVMGPSSPWRPIVDDDLRYLSSLHRLELLDMSHALDVTDAGLAYLRDLKDLKTLILGWEYTDEGPVPRFTDAGLVHLRGLLELRELSLNATATTDAGLANLAGLTNLESLGLSRTQVTDAGLSQLMGLTRLESLRLSETQVTDAGLRQLQRLPRLRQLDVTKTQVTRAGIVALIRANPELDVVSDIDLSDTSRQGDDGP